MDYLYSKFDFLSVDLAYIYPPKFTHYNYLLFCTIISLISPTGLSLPNDIVKLLTFLSES